MLLSCVTAGCITPNGQTNCPRVFWFSSPLVTQGAMNNPTGIATSDNSRVIRERLTGIINWMPSTTSGGLIFSASPSAMSVTQCSTVTIKGWRIGTGADITSVTLKGG